MKKLLVIALSIIVVLSAALLLSCQQDPFLSKDEFSLTVGEFVDVAEYVSGDCNVSIVDSSVVSLISGTVLKGLKVGTTEILVTQGLNLATASVTVSYAKTELTVNCQSSPFTTVKGSVMEFYARIADNADDSKEIIWKKNGATVGVGKNYQLEVKDYGVYTISATADGTTSSVTAVCYQEFSSAPTITASQTQISVGSRVAFSAQVSGEHYVVEWYSQDGKIASGESFEFFPSSAGIYTVYALVNGIKTNEMTVTVFGKADLANLRVDVDSYPSVYLKWEGSQSNYRISIGQQTFETDQTQFEITNIVDLYEATCISVTCLANDYLTESDTVEVQTPVINNEQISYLNKKYFDGNYYLTSDQEIYDLIAYALIFRPQAVKDSESEVVTLSAYMGYDSHFSAATLLSKGWSRLEQTGSYSLKAIGKADYGNVVTFELMFYTQGEPEQADVSYKTSYQSLLTPSFSSGYTISQSVAEAEVETSDELYFVVQKGYQPVPVQGSSAQRIYDKATDTLSQILANDMNDEQKVRAIYEWVMWNTSYDYEVVAVSDVNYAVKQPAYYLEGVFDYGFAVCDGIAKAVSLLCNMADIPCVRVVGITDNGTVSRHAWNKVCLDGYWYVIDATWGDSLITINGATFEGALHAYYLKADSEMLTHKENDSSLYPKANHIYDWYDSRCDENATLHVKDSSVYELANSIEYGAKNAFYDFSIGDSVIEREFYVIEIRLSQKAKAYFRANTIYINAAITEVLVAQAVPWAIVGDYLLVMLYR